MTEPLKKEQLEELVFLLKHDRDAIKYVLDILYAGHLWDDLIDKDRIRTDAEINQAFRVALGDIPTNPFFQKFGLALAPLQMSASLLWLDSVKLEKGDENDRMAAFIMRNALAGVVHYCMFLVGGIDWVMEHGHRLWQIFNLYDKWAEFKQE
jgi:hypothetical protein